MGLEAKGFIGETESQFDARMKSYEDEVKRTRPDVKWVNAEQYAKSIKKDRNFYGHSKAGKSDKFYSKVQNVTGC